MANLDGKHRIVRDEVLRIWNGLTVARQGLCAHQGEYKHILLRQAVEGIDNAHLAITQVLALTAISGLKEGSTGLSYVPTVIVTMRVPADIARTALLDLSSKRLIELRPDSGPQFPRSDIAIAPPGPLGSSLLWTRLLREDSLRSDT